MGTLGGRGRVRGDSLGLRSRLYAYSGGRFEGA